MRLTLDIDKVSFTKFIRKLMLVKALFPCNRISVRRSSGGRGFHIIVYDVPLSWEEVLYYRFMLGDDERRIKIDSQRRKMGTVTQVVFTRKRGREIYRYC